MFMYIIMINSFQIGLKPLGPMTNWGQSSTDVRPVLVVWCGSVVASCKRMRNISLIVSVTSDRVTSDRVTSDRVTSDRVTSDRVTSDSLLSYTFKNSGRQIEPTLAPISPVSIMPWKNAINGWKTATRSRMVLILVIIIFQGFFVYNNYIWVSDVIHEGNNFNTNQSHSYHLRNQIPGPGRLSLTNNHTAKEKTPRDVIVHKLGTTLEKTHLNTTDHELEYILLNMWNNLYKYNKTKEIMTHVIERQNPAKKDDIVLVTQLGVAKFTNFLTQIIWWRGPVTASIFLQDKQDISEFCDFVRTNAMSLENTSLVAVFETKKKKFFPINVLRNVAMEIANTDYFLALDVDFIPSSNSHEGLHQLIRQNTQFRDQLTLNKTMFVLPAFDLSPPPGQVEASADMLPHSLNHLMEMLKQEQVETFHTKRYSRGHKPTNFEQWISIHANRSADRKDGTSQASDSYENRTKIYYYWIDYADGFEPYVLGYRPGVPLSWPSFRGYGFNKCVWFMELDAAGYRFATLTDYYVVHIQHETLTKYVKYAFMRYNYQHFASFLSYVKEKYNRYYHLWVPAEEHMKQAAASIVKEKELDFLPNERQSMIASSDNSTIDDKEQSYMLSIKDILKAVHCPEQDLDSLRSFVMDIWSQLETAEIELENYRHLPQLICRKTPLKPYDIVLATHLDISKLKSLIEQIKYWRGPSSIAIYLKSADDVESFFTFFQNNSNLLTKATFHLVVEKTEKAYPHNILRNIAMENCEGEYFVALDVDFIPSPNCHNELYRLLHSSSGGTEMENMMRRDKYVFVLPAFDRWADNKQSYATVDMLPRSVAEVMEMLSDGRMDGFDMDHFPAGHGPTNFSKWISIHKNRDKSDNSSLREDYYLIQYEERFEPYILGSIYAKPKYWPWFRGYGYNKYSWFMELDAAGYHFATLIDFYVVHLEHPESNILVRTANMQENAKYMVTFNEHLRRSYNRTYKFWAPPPEDETDLRKKYARSQKLNRLAHLKSKKKRNTGNLISESLKFNR